MSEKASKSHKTIFGTTEKSNFILNMTNEQFNKFASISFSIGFILIFIFSAIAEILSLQEISEKNYDWRILPSIPLAVTGLIGISVFIIALIKQTLGKKQIIASILVLLLTVFMYISYINAVTASSDYSAFLGNRYGRYEGFMVLLCYLFIFLGSMSINKSSTVNSIFKVFTVITAAECIWAVLQFIPSFPNRYYQIPYLLKNPVLPSGTAGSPVFLATLLSIGLAISVYGALYSEKSRFSVLYSIAILPVSFFLVKTQCIIGFVSAAIIVVFVLVTFTRNKNKKKLSSTPVIMMFTGIIAAAAFIFIKGFNILDGEIIWHDGCGRLGAFGQYTSTLENSFDIHNPVETYSFMWTKAIEYIKQFPVTGIGPDAFLIPQSRIATNRTALSFDRPYNEYLYYAATLGIPAAVSFASLLIYSAVNGIKSFFSNKNWISYAALTSAVTYIVTSVITNSTATVTPFVWFLLGICCCTFTTEKE